MSRPISRARKPIRWWLVAVLVVFFLLLLNLFPHLRQVRYLKSYGLLLVLLLPALYVQVIVHELGHLALGRLAGYQLSSFRIFNLSLEHGPDGFRLQRRKAQGYGGLCLMLPPVNGAGRVQRLLFYSGGILANLATYALIRLLLWNLPPPNHFIAYFMVDIGLMGLLLGVLNLIPFTTRNAHRSDGSHILGTIRNDAAYRLSTRLSHLGSSVRAGTRPSLLSDVPALVSAQTDALHLRVSILVYGYYYHLDRRELPEALGCLEGAEALIDHYSQTFRAGLKAECMYAACALRRDDEKARTLYAGLCEEFGRNPGVSDYRYVAAYSWYMLRDREAAEAALAKGRAVAGRFLVKGLIPFELQLLDGIEQDMAQGTSPEKGLENRF